MSATQSFETLPNGSIITEGDASTRNLKTRQKELQLQKKLEKITEQLAEVRKKRLTMKRFDDGRVRGPPKDYSSVPKKLFSHPKLEFVYGEIMHSPYMTNPRDSYPKTTYTMAETLKELKQKGVAFKDIPESERPYDDAVLKRQFIKEVCNYNPKFNVPKMIKKTTGDGSVTSAGTSKRAGTATSVNGRSTANSTVASSTTSLKDDRSGSMRRRQLNEVKPRKHASATSMSLDASGFAASVNGNSDSRKSSAQDDTTSQTTAPAAENTAAGVSSAKDASESVDVKTTPEDDYNDDFEHPAENNSSANAKSSAAYDEEVFEGDEEVTAEVPAVGSGSERPPQQGQQGPMDEPVEEDVYDADFEQTTTLHAPQPAAAQPTSTISDKISISPSPVEDIYDIDFEKIVSEPTAAPVQAVEIHQQAGVSIKEEDTAYGDDFEVTDKDTTVEALHVTEAPVAANASANSAGGSVAGSSKTDADKFLDSVKLRTDLVEAPATGTARSVLSSEGITTDIRRDEDVNPGAGTGGTVPSTVRSELDAHAPYVSAPHSHTNSFLSSDLESEEPRPEHTTKAGIAEAEVPTVAAESGASGSTLQTREALPTFQPHDEVVIEQVASADEPIDEILYMESKAGGEKAGEAISNNYLNSPQRAGVSKNTFEEAQNSAVSSPGGAGPLNNNFPDEEIGEEIE